MKSLIKRASGKVHSQVRGPLDELLSIRGTYEIILIFSLLMVAEWMIPGPSSLASISPHPFWLPVVLLSVQYGSSTGLVVAVIATAASWLSGWPPQGDQEDFYAYSMRICREPVLWTICALVVGGLRNRQIAQKDALENRLSATEEQRDTIASYCTELQTHIASCERAAASNQVRSTDFALDALQALRDSTPEQTANALQSAIEAWLGPVTYTIFLPPQRAEICSDQGRSSPGGPVGAFRPLEGRAAAAMQAAAESERTLTILDGDDARHLEGLGVFASPITSPAHRRCAGLFVIEFIPPERLVAATILATELIAAALADAWTKQIEVEVIRDGHIAHAAQRTRIGETGVLHATSFAAAQARNARVTAGRGS